MMSFLRATHFQHSPRWFVLRFAGLFFLLFCYIATNAAADFSDEIVDRAKNATVQVLGDKGSGTGFVVTKQGHLVTNFHVIDGETDLWVRVSRGNIVYERRVTVVAADPTRDLAILKCENLPITKPLVLAVIEPSSGQSVMALGFPGVIQNVGSDPFEMEGLVETGRPNEWQATPEAVTFFQPLTSTGTVEKMFHPDPDVYGVYLAVANSAKISHGNSGGALIDAEGRVVGINVAGEPDPKSGVMFSWAIHVSELAALAKIHGIPVIIETDKVSAPGGTSGLNMLLLVAVAAFAVVMFLMIPPRSRRVMVDGLTTVVGGKRLGSPPKPKTGLQPPPKTTQVAPPPGGGNAGKMHLRGRDLQGHSYDLTFGTSDFSRNGGRLVIGRNNDLCQLTLSQDSVSRQHATLTLAGSAVQVEDRNSGNGTLVNGRELKVGQPSVTLHPGDKLTVGEVVLIFEIFS